MQVQPEQIRILAPMAVLILWTVVMMLWMTVTRSMGMNRAGVTPDRIPVGMRSDFMEERLEPRFLWQGHNYNHLLEQPTLFYAVALALALIGPAAWDLRLAWAYVAIRVLHSFWQSLVNTVPVRFSLHVLATTVLVVMTVRVLITALPYY